GVHRRLHRRRHAARGGDQLRAAGVAARAAMGAADPGGHARAAAPDQGPADRAAISSRRGRGPARAPGRRVTAPEGPRRHRPNLLVPALFTLVGFALLIGLGVWQLERKAWKEALMRAIAGRGDR